MVKQVAGETDPSVVARTRIGLAEAVRAKTRRGRRYELIFPGLEGSREGRPATRGARGSS